jgi:hypothetical protein
MASGLRASPSQPRNHCTQRACMRLLGVSLVSQASQALRRPWEMA